MFKIVDRKSPIDPSSPEGLTLDSRAVKGHLELQNVVFAYPARPSVLVFNNFCLQIPAGEEQGLPFNGQMPCSVPHRARTSLASPPCGALGGMCCVAG